MATTEVILPYLHNFLVASFLSEVMPMNESPLARLHPGYTQAARLIAADSESQLGKIVTRFDALDVVRHTRNGND